MENISKHIEKLLAQHDYVVVPDLGGFVVQHESAQILPDMIIPPLSTIAFNPLMLHADGLLTIEVSRSEQISYRNAADFIRKEVEKKKQDFVKSCFFDNNFSTLTVQIDDAIKNIFLFFFLTKAR